MKTLSDKYKLIKKGKYSKKEFLKEVKRNHPKLISNITKYNDAVKILKSKKLKSKVAHRKEKILFNLTCKLINIHKMIQIYFCKQNKKPQRKFNSSGALSV